MEKIVRLNMTKREIIEQAMPRTYRNFAGRALTSKIISTEVPASCHPLGQKNKFVIATGMFAGTAFPCSGRISVGGKSPLTGGIKESNAGGTAGWKLSRLGIKAIIIEGLPPKDEDLFLLKLNGDKNELIKAGELRRFGTYKLAKELRNRYGENIGIIAIGPAGEMMLSAAGVAVTDLEGNPCDYAGRGGMGAVLGSKKIKAIIIDDKNSEKEFMFHDRKEFIRISKSVAEKLIGEKKILRKYGTSVEINESNALGYLPTKNFRKGQFDGIDKISGETMHAIIQQRGGMHSAPCMPGCPIGCKQTYLDNKGKYLTSGLEYETIALLGSNCCIDDLDAIAKMARLCDDYGLDTMEMGVAIGVAMEAGLLSFGDADGAISLLEKIHDGTPLGRIIGNGAEVTGKVFGIQRVPAVKGQSLAAYDPRGNKGMGVTYMSSPMGADHTAGCVIPGRTGFDTTKQYNLLEPYGQEELSLDLQIMAAAIDSMGICFFIGLNPDMLHTLADLHRARYGLNTTFDDIVKLGKKVLEMEHRFNLAAGIVPLHHLPDFFEEEPLIPHQTVFNVPFKEIFKAMRKKINISNFSSK